LGDHAKNLGNALRKLGERREDTSSIHHALNCHIVSWQVFHSGGVSHYATIPARQTGADLSSLRNLSTAEYEECVAQHADILKQMGVV